MPPARYELGKYFAESRRNVSRALMWYGLSASTGSNVAVGEARALTMTATHNDVFQLQAKHGKAACVDFCVVTRDSLIKTGDSLVCTKNGPQIGHHRLLLWSSQTGHLVWKWELNQPVRGYGTKPSTPLAVTAAGSPSETHSRRSALRNGVSSKPGGRWCRTP